MGVGGAKGDKKGERKQAREDVQNKLILSKENYSFADGAPPSGAWRCACLMRCTSGLPTRRFLDGVKRRYNVSAPIFILLFSIIYSSQA